jgi:decaprenylphospho-beta-D-ribofuranose 2-oxidase
LIFNEINSVSMLLANKKNLAGRGKYPVSESIVISPRNEDEFRKVAKQGNLIARGLGRSYSDQAVNDNRYVAVCTRLNHFVSWDEKEGILVCEADVTLEEIISVFAPRGWFPMICPGTKFVTIARAIANDIHGKSHGIDGVVCKLRNILCNPFS